MLPRFRHATDNTCPPILSRTRPRTPPQTSESHQAGARKSKAPKALVPSRPPHPHAGEQRGRRFSTGRRYATRKTLLMKLPKMAEKTAEISTANRTRNSGEVKKPSISSMACLCSWNGFRLGVIPLCEPRAGMLPHPARNRQSPAFLPSGVGACDVWRAPCPGCGNPQVIR